LVSDACCDRRHDEGGDDASGRFWEIRDARLAAVAGLVLAGGLAVDVAGATRAADTLFVAALVVGGSTFVPQTVRALLAGRLGVGTLMTIAAIGAALLGEVAEAASLAFLFSISEALEDYALARSRRRLRALLSLVPDRVTVRRGGDEIDVVPAELRVGDIMVVGPGGRVATDGVVRAGRSALDLSAITGESIPVEVDTGTAVLAASMNGGGVLEIEVTAPVADSSLARVVHIVEEAQERKGSSQRLAERIARPLVPAIMAVAAVVAILGALLGDPELWFGRALVVLVAAAPCAFAIAVPVTVVAAVGAAARAGVLVKGGAALEALASVDIVAFDKTGTLTRNRPEVVAVETAPGVDTDAVLAVAAALEARSEHPLAAAIVDARPGVDEATDVQAVAGRGLTGVVDGRPARLGNPGFVEPGPLRDTVVAMETSGTTVVVVEHGDDVLGAVAVRDELRADAPRVVSSLRELGVTHVVMLTGDNRRTANSLGCAAGVDDVHAELLPEHKATVVDRLRAIGRTAMVGDGINDAPALATADVGIAIGTAGNDVAIEAADLALMGETLDQLPDALRRATRAMRIMRQNLALSGLIIAVLIPLAALGVLGLAAVVATHELAEVVVIANGVRAGRARPELGRATPVRAEGDDVDRVHARVP
jgi:cation-transporting ATPase G